MRKCQKQRTHIQVNYKAIYIRLADKSHVDGNIMYCDGGLCLYVYYERLRDFSDSSNDSCQSYYCARPPSVECKNHGHSKQWPW